MKKLQDTIGRIFFLFALVTFSVAVKAQCPAPSYAQFVDNAKPYHIQTHYGNNYWVTICWGLNGQILPCSYAVEWSLNGHVQSQTFDNQEPATVYPMQKGKTYSVRVGNKSCDAANIVWGQPFTVTIP